MIQDGAITRQMTPNELLVLTLPLDDVKCNNYGSIFPFADEHVLTETEIANIQEAVDGYNVTIAQLAEEFELGLVDMNKLIKSLASNDGLNFDGVNVSTTFVSGGVFSLDGIHPTPKGNAIIANEFIATINATYGANVPMVNQVAYSGVVFPD